MHLAVSSWPSGQKPPLEQQRLLVHQQLPVEHPRGNHLHFGSGRRRV